MIITDSDFPLCKSFTFNEERDLEEARAAAARAPPAAPAPEPPAQAPDAWQSSGAPVWGELTCKKSGISHGIYHGTTIEKPWGTIGQA